MNRKIIYTGLGLFVLISLAGIFAANYTDASENEFQTATSSPLANIKEITHGDTSKKEVIFTFDGGGTAQSADQVLQVLAKHGVKGTFFLTGIFVLVHPNLVKNMVAQGDEIFSHTFDHPNLTTISSEEITSELTKMESVLLSTAGVSPKPYFRAPYGARDARVISVAAANGYESVYWTVDGEDWKEPQGETAADVENRILSSLAPGTIYLMHLGDTITGSILDDVFTKIEAQGYKIVSLSQGI